MFEALFGFFVFIAVVMAIVAMPVWGARNRARTIHGPYLKVISENKGDHIEKHPENTEFLEEYLSEPELTELRQLDKEDVDEIPTGNQATKLLDCLTNTACVEKHWNIQSLRNKRKKDLSIIHITDNNTFYYNLRLIYFIC